MERPAKSRIPSLSLVLPSGSKKPSQGVVGPSDKLPQTSSLSHGVVPAKQKRLFPIACRLVPMDQWFTTRIDRTWNVLDLKIWLLSKALPTPVLPLPASYRPSSPVTFAAAPQPPPRPPTATPYHTSIPPAESLAPQSLASSQVSPISPITFAPAPSPSSRTSTSTPHASPQTPGRQVFYPADILSQPASAAQAVSSPSSSVPQSFDQDDQDVSLYVNSHSAVPNNHSEDEDDEDADDNQLVRIMPRSIPYSYNTGAPAISGLAALKPKSNKIIPGRGYSSSLSSVDMDLVRQATTIAKRWHVYSFSTGMLLSDDLPLTEYSIRPYELLELHRAGAYVSLPRPILPGFDLYSSSHHRDASDPPLTSTKTTFAYPSSTTRRFHPPTPTRQSFSYHTQGDARDHISSDSSDDEYEDMTAGSPYAQPYFDGWVWVLRDGASGANGSESGNNDGGDGDGLPGRKMRRRGRAKSETSKSGRGKDRARMEREWKQPLRKDGDAEVQLQDSGDLWNKRWLIIREGIMTLWKGRKDDLPEERYRIAACGGLYGADRLQSVLAATSHSSTPFATPVLGNANPPHASAYASKTSLTSPTLSHHIICARFRERSVPRAAQAARLDGKSSGKSRRRIGTWVVLKVADATVHEHLLRIFHRLSYSSPVSSTDYPPTSSSSVISSRTLHTRTLRTDFLPNPIPHPLSLSFSAPSPIQPGDESLISPFDDFAPSDGSEYDDECVDTGPTWGRSRRKALGKCAVGYVGLGDGVGVRYPEWRENVIRKAIHVGQGLTSPEFLGSPGLTPETETPRTDHLHMYGLHQDLDNYPTNLARDDYDSDDSDSDTFSETEWECWAYDLDRPKVIDDIEARPGYVRRPPQDGLTTPHGSPVSDPELPAVPGSASDGGSFPPTSTLRPRSQSFGNNGPTQADVSTPLSPRSASPTTPGARARASTISAHPHNSSATVIEPISVEVSFASSGSTQMGRGDTTAALRTVEPNTSSGVRNLMRGLSMRAGKESFLRGLENALDFVEGK